MRQPDLHPGDIPEGHPSAEARMPSEDDAWVEAKALVDTIEDHELIDPEVASERLLYRLSTSAACGCSSRMAIHEACRCSRERIMTMMRGFNPEDRRDMIGDDGRIGITCEFCSRAYDLDPAEVEAEMALPEALLPRGSASVSLRPALALHPPPPSAYLFIIDYWPDDWAASPRTAGRTFRLPPPKDRLTGQAASCACLTCTRP